MSESIPSGTGEHPPEQVAAADGAQPSPPTKATPETFGTNKGRPDPQVRAGAESLPTRVGRFEIRRLLGRGTFGSVHLALDPIAGREVAIKVPNSDSLSDEEKSGFLREARAAAAVEHRHVCPVYEANMYDGVPYIVMPFLPTTLEAVLRKIGKIGGKMPPRKALTITRALAEGLVAAHARGVIHRDLKPANVLHDPETHRLLIADFGLAKFVGLSATASGGGAKGTPLYMPPEQWSNRPVDARSDVYSLGVMLFEMLIGRPPFTGSPMEVMLHHCHTQPERPSLVRADLDPAIDNLCLIALAKEPDDRYQSADEFARAISAFVKGIAVREPAAGRTGSTGGFRLVDEKSPPPTHRVGGKQSAQVKPPPEDPEDELTSNAPVSSGRPVWTAHPRAGIIRRVAPTHNSVAARQLVVASIHLGARHDFGNAHRVDLRSSPLASLCSEASLNPCRNRTGLRGCVMAAGWLLSRVLHAVSGGWGRHRVRHSAHVAHSTLGRGSDMIGSVPFHWLDGLL